MRAIPNDYNKDEFLLFRTDKHIKRLSQSSKLLLNEISEEYIFNALKEVIKKNKPRNPIYIRPFVYTSDLGIAPRLHNIETDFFIYCLELGDYLSPEGVSCRMSSWTRQEDLSLIHI